MKKTFVLLVSKKFLAGHPKCGQDTNFKQQILDKKKIHTIRGNYPYWAKIVEKVNSGEAVLEIRQWADKPYRSKQELVCKFEKLGIQSVVLNKKETLPDRIITIGHLHNTNVSDVSGNDGFDNTTDFLDWFPSDFGGCVIHFTDFRY